MKEFRKNKQKLFICEECDRTFVKKDGLSKHIRLNHNGQKEYFDKWIKENDESLCKCGNHTLYTGFKRGYRKSCCDRCSRIQNNITQRIRYGNCGFGLEKSKKQQKQTNLKRYGVECVFQSEIIKDKIKQTCQNHFGVEYSGQAEIKKQKCKQTCLEHFGVEYPSQNKEINEKSQKARFEFHKFRDTDIWYQCSYELDFLEKYYDKFPNDVKRAKSIKYLFKEKIKIYHPDFYISSLNLIVECKNSYLAKKDKDKIEAKKNATIANGFNYIMIINKNYKEFENIVKLNVLEIPQLHFSNDHYD
jgi:hypothetical protein